MFIISCKELNSKDDMVNLEPNRNVEVIDTEDGVVEIYPWHKCIEMSKILDDFYGVEELTTLGIRYAYMKLTKEVLHGFVRCSTSNYRCELLVRDMPLFSFRAGKRSIKVIHERLEKSIADIVIPGARSVEDINICRVAKMGDYYRVWVILTLQIYEEDECNEGEVILDFLFTNVGLDKFQGFNGVISSSNCYVKECLLERGYGASSGISAMLKLADTERV